MTSAFLCFLAELAGSYGIPATAEESAAYTGCVAGLSTRCAERRGFPGDEGTQGDAENEELRCITF